MNENIRKAVAYLVEEYGPTVLEAANNATKEYLDERIGNFLESFKTAQNATIYNHNELVLDLATLTEFGRKYRVSSSDGVAAMKVVKNNTNIIYLTYTKNRELIPSEENCYIVIQASALTPEVINLFEGHKLIILK